VAAACSTARPWGVVYQNGTSTKPFVVLASSWFDSWNPSDGTWGLVPYGTRGSVSALATGARAIAPPIAAAANHRAIYSIVFFMMFSCVLGRHSWLCPVAAMVANMSLFILCTFPFGLLPHLGSARVSLIVRQPRSRG
jgi:hypothetical protein